MSPERRPDRLIVFAPAKINLCLHVGDKRADGFHELESLVAFVDAGDVLRIARADDLLLTIEGPFADGLSIGDDNLVLKAARLLSARAKSRRGARITLQKNLPVASGIGGGSADAAATLRGLVDLWGLDLSPSELIPIAAELGSDVPVCLESAPAWMEGRGEAITAISDVPDFWMVLANPGVSVSTAEVFRKLGRPSHPPLEGGSKLSLSDSEKRISGRGIVDAAPRPEKLSLRSSFSTRPQSASAEASADKAQSPAKPWRSRTQGAGGVIDVASLVGFLNSTTNHLEVPARQIAPEINEVLTEIAREPGILLTRMSGSGATCFGIFADADAARSAAASIRVKHKDWWAVAAKLVSPELCKPQPA